MKTSRREDTSNNSASHRSHVTHKGTTEIEALKHSKFVSFKTDAQANQFSVNSNSFFSFFSICVCIVENYSEIDWFDFEMRMRKLVH